MGLRREGESINWVVTLFILINLLVAITGTILLLVWSTIPWMTWLLAGVTWFLTGMLGITVGYHRLFSHQSFKTVLPVRFLLLLFGAGAFEGSVLEWCTDHRNHHKYVDTPKDPYNINRGFWYAHIGWLLVLNPADRDFSNVDNLNNDFLCHYQHKYYIPTAIISGYIIPMLIAGFFWGDYIGGLLVAGALRIAVLQQFTFCINSVCHYFGKRTYNDKLTACDNAFAAYLTFGEGYHNYHHQFPLDYRNGLNFYDYDPSKWFIALLNVCGLASDLKRVSKAKQIKYKVRFDWQKVLSSSSSYVSHSISQCMEQVTPMYDSMLAQIKKVEHLERSILELKNNKKIKATLHNTIKNYKSSLKIKKIQLKLERLELKRFLKDWETLLTEVNLLKKEMITS